MNKNKLNQADIKSALAFARFQRNRYFKTQEEIQSQVITSLNNLTTLCEETITKETLRDLMKLIFTYCKAHNLYTYYRDEVSRLILKLNGDNDNGNTDNTNCEN